MRFLGLCGATLVLTAVSSSVDATAQEPPKTPPAAAEQQAPANRPPRARNKKKARVGKAFAVATYPGFRMLPEGASRVFVEVNRKVDVAEHKAEGRVVYRLRGVAAPTKTNRLPLVTTYFRTPVSRAQLVEGDEDVELVIDLRMPTEISYRIIDTEAGGIVLQIDFPAPPAPPPVPPADETDAPRETRSTETKRIGK